MPEPSPPDPAHLEKPQAATSPPFQPSTATSWLEKTQQVNAKLFMVKKLLFVVFLFGLDVRDLYYKIAWIGPMDSFSFKAGSTSILHTTPLVSAVTRDVRAQNAGEDVASGWSSFLSQCEDMYAFGDGGGPFFLSALAKKCHFPATSSNDKVKVIPQLVLTSNLRVDALIWASCMLLHIGRRPSICQNHIATHFNDRYGFFAAQVNNSAVAPLESDAEAEILRLLDMLGTSIPLHRVICVEAFELAEGVTGAFTGTLYGCASPNLYRSEFVGFAAPQYRELLYGKGWLTNDNISVLGQRFTIRQNTHSEYIIDYNEDLNQTSIQSKTAMNFSSTGPIYALMVVIDIALLLTHCYSFDEIVKWMLRPKYRALQQWIRDFETAENGIIHAPGSSPESKASHGAVVLEEERFHSLFCASFYKHTNYLWLMRLTRVISWIIILPNSVVWTWSDSTNEKFQAYLSSIKCWVLISGAMHFLWRTLVKINERRAFQFVKGTYITNPEIVTIGAIAAAWLQDDVFLMCEKKWAIESQRVNDVTSFVGGYIAHGNTFQMANDYRTTTSLQILHILYGPLLRIILLSIGMIASWLIVKYAFFCSAARCRAKGRRSNAIVVDVTDRKYVPEETKFPKAQRDGLLCSPDASGLGDSHAYARLPLEDVLDLPIRANSLVRYGLAMEIVRDGKRYIRPSCYLEYGIMLKYGNARAPIGVVDIFKQRINRREFASVAEAITSARSVVPSQRFQSDEVCACALREIATPHDLCSADLKVLTPGSVSTTSMVNDSAQNDDGEQAITYRGACDNPRGTPAIENQSTKKKSEMDAEGIADRAISRVNAGVHSVDEIAHDDDRDDVVEQLNLHGNCIESMNGIEAFSRLVELCLSNNFIQEISFAALEPLVHLKILDLSANSIASTVGFPPLSRLEELSLAHNRLTSLDGLTRPIKFPKLRYLDLRGNDIAVYTGVVSLQYSKCLSQLRLQAADGSQSNPACDLDDYPRALIKMLPQLMFLDEEEVSFLMEVGNLHMPKYQSILRRIKQEKFPPKPPPSPQPPQANSAVVASEAGAIATQHHLTPRRRRSFSTTDSRVNSSQMSPIQVVVESKERRGFQMLNNAADRRNSPPHSPGLSQAAQHEAKRSGSTPVVPNPHALVGEPSIPLDSNNLAQDRGDKELAVAGITKPNDMSVHRVLIKDACTNTELDFEKEIVTRELAILQKESDILAKEKLFFTKESDLFSKEKELSIHILKLQEELSVAITRAMSAEAEAVKVAKEKELLQKEKEQNQALQASAMADETRKTQTHSEQQHKLELEMTELQEAHRHELEMLKTIESNLLNKLEAAEVANRGLAQKVQEKETELRAHEATFTKYEAKVSELLTTSERVSAEHNSVVRHLSNDLQSYKERYEHAEKRNVQLEHQVKEIKANLEAVYNKCVEKDEEIHRLKRTFLSKAEDFEDIKAQHAKATDRLDRLAQQQKELFDQRLETSIAQMEMEFRKEHYHSMNKLQLLQRKYQSATKEITKVRDAYQMSLKREATARNEIAKLEAILADDKQKLFVEETKRIDAYELKLKEASAQIVDLQQQLEAVKGRDEKLQVVEATLEDLRAMNARMRKEIKRQNEQVETWNKLEDDLRAALKVKDVMLDDQQRQITELHKERQEMEQQLQDEIGELQGQIEDLEIALDENLQKVEDEEARCDALTTALQDKDCALQVKLQEIDELSNEVSKKHGALELIETEMERMREVLNDQNNLLQKRLQEHMETHREELERANIAAEDSRELLRIQWEAERTVLRQRYESITSDLRDVAAQNAKLRVNLQSERKKNSERDQEMRVLLAQIDHERHLKKQSLTQIKSLFEQLQQETP